MHVKILAKIFPQYLAGIRKNTDRSPETFFWDPTSTNQNVEFCKAIYKIILYKMYKKVDTLLTFKLAATYGVNSQVWTLQINHSQIHKVLYTWEINNIVF